MDIAGTYAKFQHEQVDATDPARRTRFDAFGHVIETPTVEGFDQWGTNPHDREQAKALARRQDAEHAHALALRREAMEADRRACNRAITLRKLVK